MTRESKSVLVINSYYSHYTWTKETLRGIDEILNNSEFDIEIYLEYLDSRRHPIENLEPILFNLFKEKAKRIHEDVILVSDNYALEFVLKYRDELFPDIPIVFCGINNFSESMIENVPLITGVVERSDYIGTLELALMLEPNKRRVYVVDDLVWTDSPAKERFDNEVTVHFNGRLEFAYLSNLTFDELVQAVEKVPEDSFLFVSSFFFDRNMRYIEEQELTSVLFEHSPVSIYTSFGFYFKNGVLGGIISSGYEQGRAGAGKVLEFLRGKPIDEISIQYDSPNVCLMDYNSLQKFNIDPSVLSMDYTLINQPEPPLYVQYANLIIGVLVVNALLVCFVIILISNNAKRRKIEKQLRDSENRLRHVLRTMPAIVLAFDQEKNVIVWNQECERVTNYSAEEMIGNPNVFRILFPDPLERQKAFNVLFSASKIHRNVEVSLVNKERQFRAISWSNLSHLYPIADWSAWAVGIDITDHKQMEEELLRTRKLESVGLLAGGIAHDFNNLLTAIVGNMSLAKDKLDEKSYSYKRLQEAETASFRAKELTLQLLTFAKGGAPVKRTEDIKAFVKETALFSLRGSNVRCEFEFDEQLFLVDVDSGQMSQVVQNLVINANQAMPEGGVIHIKLNNCSEESCNYPPSLTPGNYVCLSIHDEGVGIQQQYLNKIFDPYFTTKQKGNGLGLATVYSIVNHHGGYITAQSTLGVGSTFYIYLPASNQRDMYVGEISETPVYSGSGKILVMDDDESVRMVVGEMLSEIGFQVDLSCDGEEVAVMYQQAWEAGEPYCAVILDLTVPGGVGGSEAVKRILEINPDARAIVSSGYSNDPVLAEYKRYGFSGTIGKPYMIDELRSVLHHTID